MAARIRDHDWAATPLGPTELWPASLRSIIEMLVPHGFPMVVLWGAELIQIYNDGYRTIMADKHPAGLGQLTAECWPEVWHINAPIYERVLAGETVTFEDALYPIKRHGPLEDAWFTLTYSPLRGDGAAVAGVLVTVTETTDRVRESARRDAAEAALHAREERFRAFVTASADVVYRMSPDWSQMWQLDGAGFLADTAEADEDWREKYILHADRERVEAAIQRAIGAKAVFELEHPVIRADGTPGWTSSRAVPILGADGEIVEWLGAAKDVTERKRGETALRESEALRRIAQAGGRMGSWRWDLGERTVRGDAQFLALWGFPPSDEPLPLAAFTARQSEAGVSQTETVVTKAIAAGEEFDAEVEVVSGPTAGRWLRWRGRATPAGNGVLYGVSFDITEQRQAETALRESEDRLREVLNSMAEGFALFDPDFTIVDVNDATLELDGRAREELVERSHWDAFPGSEDSPVGELFKRVMRDRTPGSLEHAYTWPDGRRMWIDVRAYPNPGGRVACFWHDITKGKQAAEALRGSEERQAFLLKLSDALRPLSDPAEMIATTSGLLGRHMGVGRCGYGEVDATGAFLVIQRDWTDGVMASLEGTLQLDQFGEAFISAYRAGRTIVLDDVYADARAAGVEAAFEAIGGLRASLAVPLVKHDQWKSVFYVQQSSPRHWTSNDEALVRDVAERTWAAVERARAEAALRDSEERLRQFGEATQDVLWVRDAETLQWEYLTPAFETIYGLDRDAALRGDNIVNWLELVVPEDRWSVSESLERVRSGEWVTFEFRVRRPSDGQIRWLRNTDFPIRSASGTVQRIGGIGRDITVERETADRMGVLVAELQHRTRNLMGVVRSTTESTLRSSGSLEDFASKFRDRIGALARVNSLLSRLNEHDRVTFDEVIGAEIAALVESSGSERVTLDGPHGIALRSSTVQTFALALHELATNAVKYGALGQPEGHLLVRWRLERPDGDGQPWLHVDWVETGVDMPPTDAKPQGGGAGRALIERALPYQLGAKTSFVIAPDGVRCSISLPVSARTVRENSHAPDRLAG